MKKLAEFLLFLLIFSFLFNEASAQWDQLPSGSINNLMDIHFPSSSVGYIVGHNGEILKTNDVGNTWVASGSSAFGDLEGVYFLDEFNGFIAGYNGMYHTTDGGLSWVNVPLTGSSQLLDVYFLNASDGFACGIAGSLYKTEDSGLNWYEINSGSDKMLSCINFPSENVGYIVSVGYNWGYLKTTDGGNTWNYESIAPATGLSSLETVYFKNESEGFIGGWYLSCFVKTSDGANSWTDLAPTGPGASLYDIDFSTDQVGLAAGWTGAIYTTHDGGDSWADFSPTNVGQADFYSIEFVQDSIAFVVGAGGTIVRAVLEVESTSTGIESVKLKQELILYPNPATRVVHISSPSKILNSTTVNIYNSVGKLVYSQELQSDPTAIDLANLPSGIYHYEFITQGLVSNRNQLIIQ